jgi:hypothetical protein
MFDNNGTLIPDLNDSFFSYPSSNFYRLSSFSISDSILAIARLFNLPSDFLISHYDTLLELIRSTDFKDILKGPSLPFYLPSSIITDIGTRLENSLMPLVSQAFTSFSPNSHFKAVIQDKKGLPQRLLPRHNTQYSSLIEANAKYPIIGYYFPLVFNQFSVSSQVAAFNRLPHSLEHCLSGPLEISSALATTPSLLIDLDSYSPILVASGSVHADNRLIPIFKSYGQHLEFWVLSNILIPGIEQVSEQWSGGLTIYKAIKNSAESQDLILNV